MLFKYKEECKKTEKDKFEFEKNEVEKKLISVYDTFSQNIFWPSRLSSSSSSSVMNPWDKTIIDWDAISFLHKRFLVESIQEEEG